jgi:hypothetical protein
MRIKSLKRGASSRRGKRELVTNWLSLSGEAFRAKLFLYLYRLGRNMVGKMGKREERIGNFSWGGNLGLGHLSLLSYFELKLPMPFTNGR